MGYQSMWEQENEAVRERYELTMERIDKISQEQSVGEPYRSYFVMVSSFIEKVGQFYQDLTGKKLEQADQPTWQKWNQTLYHDILPSQYQASYANPVFAVETLGSTYGALLAFLYSEVRNQIIFAHESRLMEMTILNELFIEIYNLFESEDLTQTAVKDAIYWFNSDYCDVTITQRVRELLDPSLRFAVNIITDFDLTDLAYLYHFGEYISEEEIKVAAFLNQLPQETIDRMADTYTEGYIRGFQANGRNLSKKKSVVIRYQLGFERMVKKAISNLETVGLVPIIYRTPVWSINKNPNRKIGYHSISANKQYDYDHRYDHGIYWNKMLMDRKLAVLKVAYETYRQQAADFAGPAVIETFGEAGFEPVNHSEAIRLNEKQEKQAVTYANEAAKLTNQYIPGDETSFTIIAFPLPSIGTQFADIFAETIRINTLDYELYKDIQQILINALDQAEAVRIIGGGANQTDLTVAMQRLNNPEQETNFENCVADVNIPLGEVFTSPCLAGTKGLLHVSSVYIGDIQFKDLKMWFEDGMVTKYSCQNFEQEKENRELIRQVIMKNHETLPMGEFAIGTNTTAYAMAQTFGILEKLPILIVEKMGPHFAVGDTCYSWSEDSPTYNPDGKEIIARDNEISALRKEDISKAYFNCHTDITIPYDELGTIEAVKGDGEIVGIIKQGKFVLAGTEELNKPLT